MSWYYAVFDFLWDSFASLSKFQRSNVFQLLICSWAIVVPSVYFLQTWYPLINVYDSLFIFGLLYCNPSKSDRCSDISSLNLFTSQCCPLIIFSDPLVVVYLIICHLNVFGSFKLFMSQCCTVFGFLEAHVV